LKEELEAACLEADERGKWRRHECDVMVEWWRNWERREGCPEVWGVPIGERRATASRSVSTPRSRERFVHPIVWPCAPGELARRYLTTCMKAQRQRYPVGSPMRPRKGGGQKLPFRKTSLGLLHLERNACYYVGGKLAGEWTVVDIDSAYYSVATAAPMDLRLGIDAERVYTGLGRCEFLRAGELVDKGVQRAVVGMFTRTAMAYESYGKPKVLPFSSFCSPGLTGLVHLTMSAIAYDAIRNFGAVHFVTDAAIVPLDQRDAWQRHLRDAWGLASHVLAEGDGVIYGHNCWEIGEQSRNVARFRTAIGAPVVHLVGQGAMRPELVASVRGLRADLLGRTVDAPPWPSP